MLKVDYRLDMPKNVEAHLRDKVKDLFTPIDAERQVWGVERGNDRENKIVRTLLVTEFCNGGDPGHYRKTLTSASPDNLVECSGKLFEQMARGLLQIQQAGCIFPDAKSSNWLMDDKNQLRIADTKSFLFTNQGKCEKKDAITSVGFKPPEYDNQALLEADSFHAYILGKNLYSFLTNTPADKLGHNGADFDFSLPVFATPKGQEFQALIVGLVKPNPADRITVEKACDKLSQINKDARDESKIDPQQRQRFLEFKQKANELNPERIKSTHEDNTIQSLSM